MASKPDFKKLFLEITIVVHRPVRNQNEKKNLSIQLKIEGVPALPALVSSSDALVWM